MVQALRALAGRQWSCRRALVCKASDDKGKEPLEGRADVQDALENVIRLNLSKMEALEQLDSVTSDEKLKVIKKVDEANDELDEVKKLNEKRARLAFGSALADIDEQYRIMEAQLRSSREEMEADQADFEAFQDKLEADRQAGLWFKKLYSRGRNSSSEVVRERSQKRSPAVTAMHEVTAEHLQDSGRKAAYSAIVIIAGSMIIAYIASGHQNDTELPWGIVALIGVCALAVRMAVLEPAMLSRTNSGKSSATSDLAQKQNKKKGSNSNSSDSSSGSS